MCQKPLHSPYHIYIVYFLLVPFPDKDTLICTKLTWHEKLLMDHHHSAEEWCPAFLKDVCLFEMGIE